MDHIYLLIFAFLACISSIHSKEYLRVCHVKHWTVYDVGNIDPKLCTHIIQEFVILHPVEVDENEHINKSDKDYDTTIENGDLITPGAGKSKATKDGAEGSNVSESRVTTEGSAGDSDGVNVTRPEGGDTRNITQIEGMTTSQGGDNIRHERAANLLDAGTDDGDDENQENATNKLIVEMDDRDFQNLVKMKEIHTSLKVFLSSKDSLYSEAMISLIQDDEFRHLFINTMIHHYKRNDLDGFEIDFEYYVDSKRTLEEREFFAMFLKELKEEFFKQNLTVVATIPLVKFPIQRAQEILKLTEDMEFVTIKAFGYHNDSNKRGHNAPLYSTKHNSTVEWTMNYWVNIGFEPSKLVLGIEFKTRCYTLDKITFNVNYGIDKDVVDNKCPPTKENRPISYRKICSIIGNPKAKRVWDVEEEVPYLVFDKLWVGFENPRSLLKKADYLTKNHFGGWAFWDAAKDDYNGKFCESKNNPLLTALNKAIMDGFDFNETANSFPEIPVGKFNDEWPLSSGSQDDGPTGGPTGGPNDDPSGKPGGGPDDESGNKTGGKPGDDFDTITPDGDYIDTRHHDSGVNPDGESNIKPTIPGTSENPSSLQGSDNPNAQPGENTNPEGKQKTSKTTEYEKPVLKPVGGASKMRSYHLMHLAFVFICFIFLC